MTNEPAHNLYYPVMPLRDIVVFPNMLAPLVVGRGRSIKALEYAMEQRGEIFLVTQRQARDDDPNPSQLYDVGTLAGVMQLLRLPDGTIKALVEGRRRARVLSWHESNAAQMVLVEEMPDENGDDPRLQAHLRELLRAFEEFAQNNKKLPPETIKTITAIENPSRLVDLISSHLILPTEEKQKMLENVSLPDRFLQVAQTLNRELELLEMEKDINAKVRQRMGKTQRNYFLGEKIRVIQQEMEQGEGDELSELEKAIQAKRLPKGVAEKTMKEWRKLKQMPPMSAETTVVRNYIDAILSLPWNKKSRSRIDIVRAEKVLDEDHFGLRKPKDRILEYLAVQAQVKRIKGPIICLVGPPGVGKTSVCKSIARAMGRKFIRLSLGGVRDEAEIRGHRRTYIGALPGKIILSMQKVGVMNPVFCLDEVDKMSMDFRGDPSAALLEVLDPEQNSTFNDHYLDVDYDLSQVFFITTANNLHAIPPPLRDRMEIIKLTGYTEEDKLHIAELFLVPKQLEANGFRPGAIRFSEAALLTIIRRYTREAGVRSLERAIASICRKVARERQRKGEGQGGRASSRIDDRAVQRLLGVPKFRFGLAEERDEIGLSTGMAWTEVGGELLQVETTLMPGTGQLTVTGKLGEVMQESAKAALSYVRSRATRLGLDNDFYSTLDIHVHVPEGAIPKDGPSAGITIATSLVSALLRVPVNRGIAMTGEITLRGRILPIGGLTEKLMAARRGNINQVLIPSENERDLQDVPQRVRNSLRIDLVEHMDQVLYKALVLKEGDELFRDPPAQELFQPLAGSSGVDSGVL